MAFTTQSTTLAIGYPIVQTSTLAIGLPVLQVVPVTCHVVNIIIGSWILSTGYWVDASQWDDTALWIDSL